MVDNELVGRVAVVTGAGPHRARDRAGAGQWRRRGRRQRAAEPRRGGVRGQGDRRRGRQGDGRARRRHRRGRGERNGQGCAGTFMAASTISSTTRRCAKKRHRAHDVRGLALYHRRRARRRVSLREGLPRSDQEERRRLHHQRRRPDRRDGRARSRPCRRRQGRHRRFPPRASRWSSGRTRSLSTRWCPRCWRSPTSRTSSPHPIYRPLLGRAAWPTTSRRWRALLLGPGARYITGQIINVNGGLISASPAIAGATAGEHASLPPPGSLPSRHSGPADRVGHLGPPGAGRRSAFTAEFG